MQRLMLTKRKKEDRINYSNKPGQMLVQKLIIVIVVIGHT